MRFSVIIPAHDAEEFLGRALASINRQTFADYEVIVVADACADRTADVAIAHGHTPIISTAGAPGLARNAGMDSAAGDYFLFLDADDWFLRADAFARIAEAIEQTDEPHLLHYGFMWGTTPFGGLQPPQAPTTAATGTTCGRAPGTVTPSANRAWCRCPQARTRSSPWRSWRSRASPMPSTTSPSYNMFSTDPDR